MPESVQDALTVEITGAVVADAGVAARAMPVRAEPKATMAARSSLMNECACARVERMLSIWIPRSSVPPAVLPDGIPYHRNPLKA